ncbi:MAG: hypothetical protein LBR36_02750 [Bacteroidales bacterium]|jgi:hypothetical protein|nr:hypothetical protein [Bacteroidales bacterium]
MKNVLIMIILLLSAGCSYLKNVKDKTLKSERTENIGDFDGIDLVDFRTIDTLKLFIFNIKEYNLSLSLETINSINDTILVVIPKENFNENIIKKDQMYDFELFRCWLRVPQMESLTWFYPLYFAYKTDTICKCVEFKDCPRIYFFKSII